MIVFAGHHPTPGGNVHRFVPSRPDVKPDTMSLLDWWDLARYLLLWWGVAIGLAVGLIVVLVLMDRYMDGGGKHGSR